MTEEKSDIADAVEQIGKSFESGVYGPVNVVDGLFAIAGALVRLAEAVEEANERESNRPAVVSTMREIRHRPPADLPVHRIP